MDDAQQEIAKLLAACHSAESHVSTKHNSWKKGIGHIIGILKIGVGTYAVDVCHQEIATLK